MDIVSAITNAVFTFTGAPQFYTTPVNVTTLSVVLYGATNGDVVSGRLPVSPGQVLQLNIGGRGESGNIDVDGLMPYQGTL